MSMYIWLLPVCLAFAPSAQALKEEINVMVTLYVNKTNSIQFTEGQKIIFYLSFSLILKIYLR